MVDVVYTTYQLNIYLVSTIYIPPIYYNVLPINCLSTSYQLPIHSLSTIYPLPINYLTTTYQWPIHYLSTTYLLFINYLSTIYELHVIICISHLGCTYFDWNLQLMVTSSNKLQHVLLVATSCLYLLGNLLLDNTIFLKICPGCPLVAH